MKRRDLLRTLVVFGVGTLVNPVQIWTSCARTVNEDTLNEQQIQLLDEIAETILPAHRGKPGAKEAGVAAFLAGHIQDCHTKQERQDMIRCIVMIDETAVSGFKKTFVELGTEQKFELIKAFDRAVKDNADPDNVAYTNYSKLRSLIVFAFFTSESGMMKYLRYAAIPGKYSGQIPYQKGDKLWAFN